ncbi:hypothetical protein FDA94_29250 [Herbidospora galbida]|uniref:Uncharacterized protein n=1 Tax=Herbidospora galbida TaxID=2575442 RepID=A0A4V5UZY3_9ACTN|nr:hypothetical protein [Herbidospora galbida]TKK84703.1 hypothetical protein FDA94_29250 [Herbidospora galbida]
MGGKLVPPAEGDVYELQADFGIGAGSLTAGQQVTVTGVHPPGTPGLGVSNDDQVTADFPEAAGNIRTIALDVPSFYAQFSKVG